LDPRVKPEDDDLLDVANSSHLPTVILGLDPRIQIQAGVPLSSPSILSPQGPAFAMLTTVLGPDVATIHDRQIVVLRPQDWGRWLNLTKPESELLKPLPEGSLMVEQVRPGSG
jgi:hypothetical protein